MSENSVAVAAIISIATVILSVYIVVLVQREQSIRCFENNKFRAATEAYLLCK